MDRHGSGRIVKAFAEGGILEGIEGIWVGRYKIFHFNMTA